MSKGTGNGWQEINIRDSFVMFPVEGFPDVMQQRMKETMGDYKIMFAETLYRNDKDDSLVLQIDPLKNQPDEIHYTMFTNLGETTLAEAIAHDRVTAQKELEEATNSNGDADQTKQYMKDLDVIENILNKGEAAEFTTEMAPVVQVMFKGNADLAKQQGAEYFTYKHEGYRPI